MLKQNFIFFWIFFVAHQRHWTNSQKEEKNEKPANNVTNVTKMLAKTIRNNREILDDRTWDDFPVVHDYFYESEDDFVEENGKRRQYSSDFQPLCQNVRRRIELRSDVYEYHPPHYVETVCRKFSSAGVGELSRNTFNQMCSQPGFTCVQRTQTVYLTRKRYDSDCWEAAKEVIASGCDCMWPGSSFRSREI